MAWETEPNNNEEFTNKEGKKIRRQPCQVFTRVMWYLRPVSHYNLWKKSEFYERKYFVTGCVCQRELDLIEANKSFILNYAPWKISESQ